MKMINYLFFVPVLVASTITEGLPAMALAQIAFVYWATRL